MITNEKITEALKDLEKVMRKHRISFVTIEEEAEFGIAPYVTDIRIYDFEKHQSESIGLTEPCLVSGDVESFIENELKNDR